MSGMLPALLRYTELYEKRQKEREIEMEKDRIKMLKNKNDFIRSNDNTNTNNNNLNKKENISVALKKDENVLLSCVASNDNIYKNSEDHGPMIPDYEINYAINTLHELLIRSNKRTVSDGQQTSPPPLLLQTLLWLLIRCENGEKKLCTLLYPYCEKALLSHFKDVIGNQWNNQVQKSQKNDIQNLSKSTSSSSSISPSKPSRLPGVDLDFLLRESNRCVSLSVCTAQQYMIHPTTKKKKKKSVFINWFS